MNTTTKWLVTATPPTTNGDLHVGHLSGPYLAADVFRRAQTSLGSEAVYVSFGDDNQSYIVTTAERLGVDPEELLSTGHSAIRETLTAYNIELNTFVPVNSEHQKYLQKLFQVLYKAGAFYEAEVEMSFDVSKKRFLFESFIQGYCPTCLSLTKGGICEDCGHPNDSHELISPAAVGAGGAMEKRKIKRMFFDLDQFRGDLKEFYEQKKGHWRPHIIRLVDELLAKDTLGQFPMTLPMSWGAEVGLPGWEGHVWNAMAEMGPGLVHTLDSVSETNAAAANTQLVQFLGYDNSYFFAVINVCLQIAADKHGIQARVLPDWIITNEFYLLENKKFSTSKGHAIWGRELLDEYTADEVRYYVALNAPELAESNFIPEEMSRYVGETIRPQFSNFGSALDAYIRGIESAQEPVDAQDRFLSSLDKRFRSFYGPENFSMRESSKLLSTFIEYLTRELKAAAVGQTSCNIDHGLQMLVQFSAPIIPNFSRDLSNQLRSQRR